MLSTIVLQYGRKTNKDFKTAVRSARDERTEEAFLGTISVKLKRIFSVAAHSLISAKFFRKLFKDTGLWSISYQSAENFSQFCCSKRRSY